ncbi:MAG TPA: catalase [Candidatus Saccharimonadales bacterium]|nr:catalase [Candidatus Saccharimonadales bacterium]
MPKRPSAPKPPRRAPRPAGNPKQEQLREVTRDSRDANLATNQGLLINDDQNTLKAGDRGPSLIEDFHFREKITHFDHERIPERVVHARGSAAHGFFRVYESLEDITRAGFLTDPARRTPVFVRFSTVVGSRGSTDLARDVRGFAVKFYTDEGNFDLVGNNMPVFFIQDALKFPDLIHAVKPEPHNEIPQAASAHDTFWDFISLMPESTHMIMWLMSDRAIPRSYRMMEGFGVHTFRLVDAAGVSRFVKFHWKPLLGLHSVAWDEAQKISGKDPDFHRRDLWEAIERGAFPEYELGLQIVEEKDEFAFGFDLLDPTKIIPEELVPVRRVGKLTLDRNPDNFFAETEQAAFHIGHVVPGIDFSNDPLLQGRLFSYTDTQLLRLGGPNFHEIPINRPIAPNANHQRDGFHRQAIDPGRVSYQPNSLGDDEPRQANEAAGGYVTYPEPVAGTKVRARGASFFDHYSQARMFYRSQSKPEQQHLIKAFRFELGRVTTPAVRERMVMHLTQVDATLATLVAKGLGIELPADPVPPPNRSVPADGDPAAFQHVDLADREAVSPALSMTSTLPAPIASRRVAVLVTDGFDATGVAALSKALASQGATTHLIGPVVGTIRSDSGEAMELKYSVLTTSSVVFDAVFVAGGPAAAQWTSEADAIDFVRDAFKHCKTIGASGEGIELLRASAVPVGAADSPDPADDATIVTERMTRAAAIRFRDSLAMHRLWTREPELHLPL